MNQLFRLQNEKNWKSLLLTPDTIMLVNKVYKTAEEFTEKFHEKEFLKQRLEISLADVLQLSHPEKEGNTAKLFYTAKNKKTGLDLILTDTMAQQQFVASIVQSRRLTSNTSQVSVMRAIGPSLLGLGLTALFTFVVYEYAETYEYGGTPDFSGRRSLYKRLFAWLGEMLGTQGTLLAGGAIALLCIYFIYKNLKARPMEVVYS